MLANSDKQAVKDNMTSLSKRYYHYELAYPKQYIYIINIQYCCVSACKGIGNNCSRAMLLKLIQSLFKLWVSSLPHFLLAHKR